MILKIDTLTNYLDSVTEYQPIVEAISKPRIIEWLMLSVTCINVLAFILLTCYIYKLNRKQILLQKHTLIKDFIKQLRVLNHFIEELPKNSLFVLNRDDIEKYKEESGIIYKNLTLLFYELKSLCNLNMEKQINDIIESKTSVFIYLSVLSLNLKTKEKTSEEEASKYLDYLSKMVLDRTPDEQILENLYGKRSPYIMYKEIIKSVNKEVINNIINQLSKI